MNSSSFSSVNIPIPTNDGRNPSTTGLRLIMSIFVIDASILTTDCRQNLRQTCKSLKHCVDESTTSMLLKDGPLSAECGAFLTSSTFNQLRELRVQTTHPNYDFSAWATVPAIFNWRHLEALHLGDLTSDHASSMNAMLSNCQMSMPDLEELALCGTSDSIACMSLSTATVTAMGGASFPGLHRLSLRNLELSPETVSLLSHSFPLLEILDLAHTSIPGINCSSRSSTYSETATISEYSIAAALASCAHFPNLHSLCLNGVQIDNHDAKLLASTSWLAQLRCFQACDDEMMLPLTMDGAGFADLLTKWKSGPLTSLKLGPFASSDALLSICSADLPHLVQLTLMAASPMGNAVGVALRTAQLPKLEELSLYGNLCSTIEDCTLSGSVVAAANRVWETLGGFEQTQRFPHLTALHLCGATLGPAAAQSLGFFLVPQLRSLSLACCDLGLSEITSLAYGVMLAGEVQSSPGAPLLKELFLPGNGIENWCVAVLACACKHFPALQCLDLGASGHSEGIGAVLATAQAAKAWPSLTQLRCTFMGDADAAQLIELMDAGSTWNLQVLDVSPTVGEEQAAQLAAAFPSARIQWAI